MTGTLLLLLLAAGTAAVLLMLYLAIRGTVERRRAFWRRRLHGAEEVESGGLLAPETQAGAAETWSGRMDEAFARVVQQTGVGWTAEQVLGWMALTGVVLGGLLLLWREQLWLTGVGLTVGLTLPLFLCLVLRGRWRQRLQHQLPDALFLLARSLRAGESLEQALMTAAEHGPRPLADEFRRGLDKIGLGLAVPAALQGIARRLRLTDFDVFVSAVTLHRTVGGNLTLLLDRVATSTRDRNLFRGYFRAATALGRITGVFIAAAPPLLFLGYALWQPDFVARFTQSAMGMRALGIAVVLELVGSAWLYWLLRVDY